jgi:hypothetical protein
MLYCGRRLVGFVMNHMPGGDNILLHRYIIGVHFAGMLLAGIGAVWAVKLLVRVGRGLLRFRTGEVIAVALVCVFAIAVFYPVLQNRKHYADSDRYFIDRQVAADETYGRDVIDLIDIAKSQADGRVYAGASNNWGALTKVEQVPLYQIPAQVDADSLGFYLRVNSLSALVEPYFNEADAAQYDLFNVKYVLLPNPRRPAVPATLIATRGAYSLYEVNTSGYLEVVDTTEPIFANNEDIAAVATPYLSSPAPAEYRHPLIAFDGKTTATPSMSSSAPYVGPPGAVNFTSTSLDTGRFSGAVHANRDAWVMLKESYSPRWTATVDGKPVKPAMVAPSFVAVPVTAGDHFVVFKYKPTSRYPLYFAIGLVTLLALIFGPIVWRRSRRRDDDTEPSPGAPETAEAVT